MQTIETRVSVGNDRTLSMQLPADVATGEYEVVLVLNQRISQPDVSKLSAVQKIRDHLHQSLEPGHSLADELIHDRREAAKYE